MKTEKKELIKTMILEHGISLTDFIDVVIELNGIIGVGLISLGDGIRHYIESKI